MKENITLIKAESFALEIIELYNYLTNEKREFVLSKQLLRSGTSIGANVSEGECASSMKDLQNKLYIALKETNESMYWLRLLHKSGYIETQLFNDLYVSCNEIRRILTKSTITIGNKLTINNLKCSIANGSEQK